MVLDEEPISITEISQRTGLVLTTLTNVIDKMEEKRLVRRRPSMKDRRVVGIELAVAGRQVKSKFVELIGQLAAVFLELLPDDKGQDFANLLGEIVQVVSVEADTLENTHGTLLEPLKNTLFTSIAIRPWRKVTKKKTATLVLVA